MPGVIDGWLGGERNNRHINRHWKEKSKEGLKYLNTD